METKVFEVRDRHTCMTVLAVALVTSDSRELYLLNRMGFRGPGVSELDEPYILLSNLEGTASYDAFSWNNRTLRTIHTYLIKRWRFCKSGDVLDVEYILGETTTPKVSEQFS